jgi:hypothetical protein
MEQCLEDTKKITINILPDLKELFFKYKIKTEKLKEKVGKQFEILISLYHKLHELASYLKQYPSSEVIKDMINIYFKDISLSDETQKKKKNLFIEWVQTMILCLLESLETIKF